MNLATMHERLNNCLKVKHRKDSKKCFSGIFLSSRNIGFIQTTELIQTIELTDPLNCGLTKTNQTNE